MPMQPRCGFQGCLYMHTTMSEQLHSAPSAEIAIACRMLVLLLSAQATCRCNLKSCWTSLHLHVADCLVSVTVGCTDVSLAAGLIVGLSKLHILNRSCLTDIHPDHCLNACDCREHLHVSGCLHDCWLQQAVHPCLSMPHGDAQSPSGLSSAWRHAPS